MKLFNKTIYCLKSKKIYKDSYHTTISKDYPNIGYDYDRIWILTKHFNDETLSFRFNGKFLYYAGGIIIEEFLYKLKLFIKNNTF